MPFFKGRMGSEQGQKLNEVTKKCPKKLEKGGHVVYNGAKW